MPEEKRGFYLMHNDGPRKFCECGWTLLRFRKKDGETIEYCLNKDCPGYIGRYYDQCDPLLQAIIGARGAER